MKYIALKYVVMIFAGCFVLSGCGIYNRYSRPEVNTEGLYRDTQTVDTLSEEATDTLSLAAVSWKKLFTDPLLQQLIDRGLEQNTDLNIARLRVEQAEALLLGAKLAYLPSVSLNPDGSLSGFDGSKASKAYNLSVSASWELDIFGKTTNARRGAQAAFEGSRAYRQAVQTQLVSTIADTYYTLLMLDRQLAINEQTLSTWESTIRAFEALKRAGESNQTAVLQAQANRIALESSIVSARESIRRLENQLSVLLGDVPQTVSRGELSAQSFPDSLAVGVPVQLLRNRPDVRQAEFSLAQAFYATNAARAAFYPSIILSGSAGWTNNAGGIVSNPGGLLWSAIGSLAQPLFNKGANIANLRIAKAQQEEAQLTFRQTVLDAGREVNDALTQWQSANQRLSLGQSHIETLREAVRQTELLMRFSSVNYLEVLTAQQSLLAAELSQVQNSFDRIQGVIRLYHALGGGEM